MSTGVVFYSFYFLLFLKKAYPFFDFNRTLYIAGSQTAKWIIKYNFKIKSAMRKRFLFLFVLLLSLAISQATAQERQKETIQLTFDNEEWSDALKKGRQSLWVQNPIYLRRCQKPQGNLLHQDYLSRRSYQSNHWQWTVHVYTKREFYQHHFHW